MQLSQKARKAVAATLAVSTMLMGSVTAMAPKIASAAVHSEGCLVLSGGIVWMITNGTRRGYTSAEVFQSYGYSFSQVVQATAEDVALPVGPIMIYADGTLVKGPNDPLVYLVAGGQKRPFVSGAVFTGMGFSFANIQSAPVNTFSDLPTGSNMDNATMAHPDGVKVLSNGTVWEMTATGRMGFASAMNFLSYGYSFSHVVSANAADLAMPDQGAVPARPACTGGDTTPTSGNITVGLASTTPVAGTVIAGQAIADLAHFSFTGSGTVTNVKLMRTGVSADTTLASVYLYDGNVRLTDAATVSSGVITFNNPNGLFMVNGSKTVSVRANIAASTSGQTVGVKVDTTTLSAGTAVGTPMGNIHTVAATPSNFATVDFNTTTTPATATISAQDEYTMWQNVLSVGNQSVVLKSMKIRQVGSVTSSDLGSFKLYVDGTQVGSTVSMLDSDGYVNFDLGSGVTLTTGNRTVKLVGNIIAGANRNFSFSLRQAADAMLVDTQFNQAVLATAASATFSARTSGTQTIDTGTLTFTKRSDSPSGNVVIEASNAVYGRFDVKAAGENMKVESLRVAVTESDADTDFTLRNGALYLDGVQVGSTAAIAAINDATLAYTEFTFGSSFIVNAGQTRVLEIRADVYDNDGAEDIEDADTLVIRINAGSSNVQRMTSLGYGSYPASNTSGNTLTVATGSLTVANNTAYANHTLVAPKTAYKVGSYNVQASTTEGSTITSVVVDFDEVADVFDASDDLTNLYVTIGSFTSPIKATVTDTANTFSTNVAIAAGQVMQVNVYADIASTAGDGGTADTGESSITVSYTTALSSTSTSASEVDGQTLTFGSGAWATSLAGSSPLARIVAGNQTITAAEYEFSATNETYTIKEVTVKVGSAAISSAITAVQLYDGATAVGAATPFSQSTNTAALITGLNVVVPAGTPKTLTAKLILNTIGAGFGTSGSDTALTLDSVKYADTNGVEATDATDRAGNVMLVYRTIPTVTQNTVSKTDIVNGSQYTLYSFTVAANVAAPVYLKQLKLTTTWNDNATTADTLEVEQLKLFEDGSDITANVVIQDEDGNTAESTSGLVEADDTMVVSWATGTQGTVPAGQSRTYVIKGVITGFTDAADSVTFQLVGDSAVPTASHTYVNGTVTATTLWGLHDSAAATGSGEAHNFIWSDGSANPHTDDENASSSADWTNGYKVLNLDLSTESWTKDI